jgi:Ax21 family sulfation-dependent quorum factor
MKYSLLTLAFLASAAATTVVEAQTRHPSYNYVELGYTRFNTSPRIDGYTLNGSFALGERFHIFGGFSDLDARRRIDDEDGLIDTIKPSFDLWNIGIGYAHQMSPTTDLVARAGYQRVRLSGVGALGGSDDSWMAEVGVRSAFTPQLEGYAFAGWQGVDFDGLDVDDWSGDFYGRIGGLWHFTPNWSFNADLKLSGGDRLYFIGPRYSF